MPSNPPVTAPDLRAIIESALTDDDVALKAHADAHAGVGHYHDDYEVAYRKHATDALLSALGPAWEALKAEIKRLQGNIVMDYAIASEARADAAERERTWQPIATAPKNGISILVTSDWIDANQPFIPTVTRWVQWIEDGIRVGARGNWQSCDYRPTHWMPLPAAPVTEDRT